MPEFVAAEAVQTDSPADHQTLVGSRQLGRLLLPLVAAELALLYGPTLAWLYERWTMSVWHHAHGLLMPPLIAYFAWLELRPLRHLPPSASPLGFVFLVPALLLHVLDTGIRTQLLSAAALVLSLPGLALLFLGTTRTKAIAFPLAFSAFMLPIPLVLTEGLQLVLRQIAAAATTAIVPLLGITMHGDGTILQLRTGTLAITDACSGFSTLYAAVAAAALTAYACRSTARRVLVLVAAAPIAIAANIVRVVLLVVLVDRFGFGVLSTWVHPATGMLTFVLSLPAIFWLGHTAENEVRS